MRHISFFVLSASALFLFSAAAVAEVTPAEHQAREALAHSMANITLSVIKDQRATAADRQDNLKRSFAKVVDIDWIAKFVAGGAWRDADDTQRTRYTKLYREYLSGMYVSNYAESRDRKVTDIKVVGINDSDADESRFTARTEVVISCKETLQVDYLVAAQEDGGYKIIDVVIEGVSLLATHRAEFGKIAVSGGIESVITKLEQLASADKTITLSMK